MTVDFNDYFWGEKNNGFDVLYHNMKHGLVASKELSEFFREKSNIEEQNSKLMSKLAHKASTGTLNSTFAPVWTILRTSAEKLSSLHLQMVQKLTELVKDVAKYADELHKKHKAVKEEESHTLECVQAMQASTVAVQKQRDLYTGKVQELEKLRRENASQKDIEKLETKLRKLQDEYKTLMDKHNPIKNEFERRMTQSCKRFQEIEEMHLRQMKEFLSTYLELLQTNHDMVGQVHSDFKRQFLDMTVDKLLEQFVLNKYTGLEKPNVPDLEFVPLSIQQKQQSLSASRLNQSSAAASIISGTNSNSAVSLQGAISRVPYGPEVTMEQRGGGDSNVSVGSGSGSGSFLNAADDLLYGSTSQQPSSPTELVNATNTSVTSSASAPAATTQAATAPSSAASVKSNFRNWFSTSIPSSKQQHQQQNTANTSASSSSGNVAATVAAATTAASATVSAAGSTNLTTASGSAANGGASSSGNIGMDSSNGSSTNGTTTIMKNSPNSELQSLQDNNNQGVVGQTPTSAPLDVTSSTTSVTSSSSTTTTTGYAKKFLSESLSERAMMNYHNQTNALTSSTGVAATTTATTTNNAINTNSSSRRTTSLLNIFTSNSQVSGILRSRRDKAKTKKLKKKKDTGRPDSNDIQEERIGSNDRARNGLNSDEHGPGGVDSSTGIGQSAGAPSSNAAGSVAAATAGIAAAGASGSAAAGTSASYAGGGGGGGGNNIDEDGYSIQPPKEIAWEEHNEKSGSFYSDSDSDSDNDKPERRIHVKIKPLNNGQAPMSASVDELRATVENISLSPTGIFSHSQQLQQTRIPSRQQSPEISNASTPTATMHPYAPLQSPTLSMSNNARYADLGDIFAELGEGTGVSSSAPASATLSKAPNSRQIPTPTSSISSIAIPRPPSRRSEMIVAQQQQSITNARGRMSPSPINRADSIGSLEFRTTVGGGVGSSRGPSPLTIGITDTIPLAVAFHEIIHAYFRGSDESRCQVKISGDMMVSFPAGIAGHLANNPNPAKLVFRLKNMQNLENSIPNPKFLHIDKNQSNAFSTFYEFNMPALTAYLRRQAEHDPTAPYLKVDILKYQVRTRPGASSCPFQLVSYWKCEPTFTALKIDYKYNNHAMASPSPLLNVTLSVPVNGSVRNVQSKPHSAWLGESNRLVWNFTDISQNSLDAGVGTLRARLELNDGPSTPALVATQFNCEGTTLSGVEFELQGSGYRSSLVKRRFVAGKYVCEGDGIRSGATPTPPSVGSSSPYSAKSN